MYIRYVGFDVAGSSRTYSFQVIDVPFAEREFTVKVHSDLFRPGQLSLQDGPGICYARLEQELRDETPESRVEACLSIGERDIKDYLEQHLPKKPESRRKMKPDIPPPTLPEEWWRRS